MAEKPRSETKLGEPPGEQLGFAPPQLSLPKGGGAIRGMGEKFAANPVTGTGSLTVPIYSSPGRSGFGPQLSLSYDSGSGNGPFGFGWSIALPEITRKTDKGLPQYRDKDESDIFILSGAEDLIPVLVHSKAQWTRDIVSLRTVYGKQYAIHRYRPRVEGLFARFERWINLSDPQDTFWRSISKDNIATWYGKTAESRIADPADPSRIFSWMICESYDDKGNVLSYRYKGEDSAGVDLAQVHERNRSDSMRSAKQYLKRVLYGNRTPYFPDLNGVAPVALPTDWCFELVFDFGEHDLLAPVPQETGQPWNCRLDPFSTYRSTFEIRTYRLCRRVLMFHHFADEPNVGLNCLVRSTDFRHSSAPLPDPTLPFFSFLLSVTQTGYVRNTTGGYYSSSLPPLDFEYTEPAVDETVRDIDSENLPYGIDGSKYRWVDLDGEGLSGILTEQGGSWFYKPNLSPINQQNVDGEQITLPQFGPVQPVVRKPSLAALGSGQQQLMDLSGDGQLDLVEFSAPTPGYFARTDDADWEPFRAFRSLPVLDWRNPNLKFIDLTGDGFPDLLISEDDAFWWHNSLLTEGFGPAQRVPQALDEEQGPQLVFADGAESIFLADISGDGLTDLIRVRNGEVCYWPNLGYGRFGAKVTMDQSPLFDRPDLFDGRRIHLADIDGSGAADIIYFASREIHLYFNRSGNAWGPRRNLSHFPAIEALSTATPLDLLGNGTACLVWSSLLPSNARRPMRYIDLMGGRKPHLLVRITNNLGAETIVQYTPSTKFYVADKLAGTPWLTRLPFPVHVVECVESYDYISRNRFVSRYAYHHGFYDGVEREFRGFARVDQWDTEEFTTLSNSGTFPKPTNEDPSSTVPPTWTKTWFHTGAFFGESIISKQLQQEYYSEGDSSDADAVPAPQLESMLLDDTVLPTTILFPDGTRIPCDLSGEEMREACRALRGSILRQEVYALDASDESGRPYGVSERNYTLEILQPQGPNQFGVFLAHPRETIDYQYERKLFKVVGNTLADEDNPPVNATNAADPRVTHAATLAVDPFGNVLQSVSIAYGRRYADPALTPEDQSKQSTLLATYTENSYTNFILGDDTYRTPLPSESSTYELIQFQPDANQPGLTNLFRFDELQTKVGNASDRAHDVLFENLNPTGLTPDEPYRRLLARMRTYYRPDDLGQAGGDPKTLLPLNTVQSLALPGSSYKLATTPGLIAQAYQRAGAALLPAPATVLGTIAPDGGGYIDLDRDGHWWVPSGRIFYSFVPATSLQEKSEALQHFFLPRRFEDPFGNATFVDYDSPHDLLVVKTADAVANTVIVDNNYRILAPALLTDPNGNRAAATFDALGMVAGTAVMGKTTENLGDSLSGFIPDLTQAQIDSFYAANDPRTSAETLLGNATTRILYDVQKFLNSRIAAPDDPSKWQPVFAATLARETHVSDLTAGQPPRIQIAFSYSDGFGHEIQKKIQAEPGPVVDHGPVIDPRWVGSGWTIFNNKGKPVRQYEPFFSKLPAKGHQFEFNLQAGVSPILCYDPVQRVVATLNPNHTWQKVLFDPWRQETWDVNDTVLIANPADDPAVGGFLKRLPQENYLPTWYAQRIDGALGIQEQTAASKASVHAATPTVAHMNTLGRTFLTVAHNRLKRSDTPPSDPPEEALLSTRVLLDIVGNQLAVIDALDRIVMRYDYDMLGKPIHSASMEAGERWMLNDISGKPIRAWDSRAHAFRTEYDVLRRPLRKFVVGSDAAQSDPRVLDNEVMFEIFEYGEDLANAAELNLRTRVRKLHDTGGVVTTEVCDFKGNPLRGNRQLASDYKNVPNWSGTVPLEAGALVSSTTYDALNRPVTATSPDGSIIRPTHNEANLLERIDVNLHGETRNGEPVWTPFVTNIDYSAKGQRETIDYGNGVRTQYTYDPLTFRLVGLLTRRDVNLFPADCPSNPPADWPGCAVQNLSYTFDPAGNIVHVQDDAQQTIYFRNRRVDPSSDYTYDAIYQLLEASGREHLGQNRGVPDPPTAPDAFNAIHMRLPQPGDGTAMGRYLESYVYDVVGNILAMQHRGSDPTSPGWTRAYAYQEPSLIECAKVSNRLSNTQVGDDPLQHYPYDAHGSMTSMPHLPVMQWTFLDQLRASSKQVVTSGTPETTYYVYDAAGQRVRKITERQAAEGVTPMRTKERIYAGGFEICREYAGDGIAITLERETLHVMDDKQRIALVETRTQGEDGSPARLLRYQIGNHLGSASMELDETAQIISYEEYFPYGSTSYQAVDSTIKAAAKRYRYSGKERDEETGMAYHGARYLANWLGRWISADPAGTVDGPNRYFYGRNQPCGRTDDSGQQSEGEDPEEPAPWWEVTLPKPIPIGAELDPTISGETWSGGVRVLSGDEEVRLDVQPPRIPRPIPSMGNPLTETADSGNLGEWGEREIRWDRELKRFYEDVIYRNTGTPVGATVTFLRQYIQQQEYSLAAAKAYRTGDESGELREWEDTLTLERGYLDYRIGGGSGSFTEWFSQRAGSTTEDSGHTLDVVIVFQGIPVGAWLGMTSGAGGSRTIISYEDQSWVHTEATWARLFRYVLDSLDEPEEYEVLMAGQRPVCGKCAPTLEEIAAWTGVSFRYFYRDDSGQVKQEVLAGNVSETGEAAIKNLAVNPPSYFLPGPTVRNP